MFRLDTFYLENKQSFEYALFLIRDKKYKEIKITKKNGNLRNISIPPPLVKTLQRKLNKILQTEYDSPKCVHGFVVSSTEKSKNIVTNAELHTKKNMVINFDIKDFFPSINFGRVRGVFLNSPFNLDEHTATKIAQLTIYNNALPQGAPSSPIISNLVCIKMDHQLMKIAKENSFTYTRYADDITFSTNKSRFNIKKLKKRIRKTIENNGFMLNDSKTRLQSFKQRQIVTGLIVNEKVNVSKKYKRQIRSMLHSWQKEGITIASIKHFDFKTDENIVYTYFEKFIRLIDKFRRKLLKKNDNLVNKKCTRNRQEPKYLLIKEKSFQNILHGRIDFLSQVLGHNNQLYLNNLYKFYLLKSNFKLERKNEIFECIDFNEFKKEYANTILSQVYDSKLVFTEGLTDIIYLKNALKYFQTKDKFLNLRLRFCNLIGWVNVKNLHLAINSKKIENLNIENIKQNICSLMSEQLKFCFVLDSDDNEIIKYYNGKKTENFHLIDFENKGYIEKLLPKDLIIDIISNSGYIINASHKSLSDNSKKKLKEYLESNVDSENIHSIENFIVFKDKLIKKVTLANIISHTEDIDYSKFEDILNNIQTNN